jgi:uncharacterized repeat protein (TIGR01451 family)
MAGQKMFGLLLALLGMLGLAFLVNGLLSQPVVANEPTPTPPPTNAASEPGDMLCHLADGKNCTFINPLDKAALEARAAQQTTPRMGAEQVPTHSWISASFDQDMDASSFSADTFYVTSSDNQRLAGSISYIGRLAIFKPAAPLLPDTVYTATISAEVRNTAGQPLRQNQIWTFTTANGVAPPVETIASTALAAQGMNIYFGDLHSHTSYSDGQGTPAQAFAVGRANGLDFMAISEHCFMMSETEWVDVKNQAQAATVEGQFVGLASFEYTNYYGHLNVFDTETYVSRDDPNYDTLPEFYNWLIAHPTAFAQFNHPIKRPGLDQNFQNFAFNPLGELKIVLQDLETPDQFFLSLNTGWHLGTLRNYDTHSANWGCCPLMGVVAPSLTKASILESLRARRTFFVSPSDKNLALVLQANGYWMGSAIPNTNLINFTINAYDPDPKGKPLRLNLYDRGVRVASISLSSRTTYTWQPTIKATLGHYYYAEAYYSDWYYPAYSSPIWVEQPPLAVAGLAQVVAPGASVTLDGRASYDPDGDTLAYLWAQQAGPGVGLANSNTAQPNFIAPATPGNLTFRLKVTDPGLLQATDQTVVTITNAPILAITKSGPKTVELGQPITYLLTVTNNGATPANQVTVTDTIPFGATYLSGGTLLPGNIVSWTIPNLPANGGTAPVSFTVIANQPVVNATYGASCTGCVPAQGKVSVYTHFGKYFLPLLYRN